MGTEDGIVWFLRATEEMVGRTRVVALHGRVSHATLPQLEGILTAGTEDGGLVVDLAGVDYINGAGVVAFETAAARLFQARHALILCNLPAAVRTVFDLAGTDAHLRIEATRETALQSFLSS